MTVKPCMTLSGIAAVIAVVLLAQPAPAWAQRAGEQDREAEQPTRRTPSMRITVYEKLAEAQECSENDDMACARELLEEVRAMTNLNSYETAQMWNFYAFIYYNQENYAEAIRAYENVLAQPDLPIGIETTTLYSLATLYVQQERYREGLATLDKWFALSPDPSPEPYILKAQIYYSLNEYRQGIEPVLTAIEIAEQQGKETKEGWYQLLQVFYFELENYPKVIEVLTILLERWPEADYIKQLAAIYGQEGDELRQLALYEAAYETGWLNNSSEFVRLAQMLMQADIPYKAARILEAGLNDGTIESNESNWRTFAQALQLAKEDERALPAWRRASQLADDGSLDYRLAQSYSNLARWDECVDSARTALRRGGLSREDQTQLLLGMCLTELKQYDPARAAFNNAARDNRSRDNARLWLTFIDGEIARQDANARIKRTL